MKIEEPTQSSSGASDIPPTSATVDSLLEEASKNDEKPPESKRTRKELSFEKLSNFTRVTPAQLAHITFSPDGRYQPVRPVATRSPQKVIKGKAAANSPPASTIAVLGTPAERYAGGGGIILLIDLAPDTPAEFIETELPRPAQASEPAIPASIGATVASAPVSVSARHIALDENEPEAELPESFEVCSSRHVSTKNAESICSSHLTKTKVRRQLIASFLSFRTF